MSGRGVPFHCPYCGSEDLWPHEAEGAGHGAWECRSCLRAFTLKMLGLITPRPAAGSPDSPAQGAAGGPEGSAR